MTNDPIRCRNCGTYSQDAKWCEVCGADLAKRTTNAWLMVGNIIVFPKQKNLSEEKESSLEDFDLDDTCPGVELPSQFLEQNSPQRAQFIGVTSEFNHQKELEKFEIRIVEEIDLYANRRTFRGVDENGQSYRIKEFKGSFEKLTVPNKELSTFFDMPLSQTIHGNHFVQLYQHVEGELFGEKLLPQKPKDILEMMLPVFDVVERFHDIGFLCLRLCPYTIRRHAEGKIFFESVEGLYNTLGQISLLPAISGYSAPEVYLGKMENLTPATDIFSLAMIVYFLLSNRDPPSDRITGYVPVLQARDFDPEIPIGLEPFLEKAGHIDPTMRHQSVTEFINELREAVEISELFTTFPESVLTCHAAAETHIGIGKRLRNPVNQDAVFTDNSRELNVTILAVADGVSTADYGSGDIASHFVINRVKKAWDNFLEYPEGIYSDRVLWLKEIIDDANSDIIYWVNKHYSPFNGEPHQVMGSTVVLALIENGVATITWAGDSLALLIRENYTIRLTREHNLRTLGIVDGVPVDVNLQLSQASALARCVGTFELDHHDQLITRDVRADHCVFSLRDGDRLLLTSDGLLDYTGQNMKDSLRIVETIVLNEPTVELACLELVLAANRGGGGDNIGVSMAYFTQGTALFPVISAE